MASDVENLFMCFLSSLFPLPYFMSFAHFLIELVFSHYYWILRIYIFYVWVLSDMWFCKIFSPSIACIFIILVFCSTKVFNFTEVQAITFFFYVVFLVPLLRILHQALGNKDFLLCYLKILWVYFLHLQLWSII